MAEGSHTFSVGANDTKISLNRKFNFFRPCLAPSHVFQFKAECRIHFRWTRRPLAKADTLSSTVTVSVNS